MKSRSGPLTSNVTVLQAKQNVGSSRPSWLKPRIPPGRYTVAFDSFHTENFYKNGKTRKLVLNFHVIDMGEYFETPLQRYYQVAEIGKKSRKRAAGSKQKASLTTSSWNTLLAFTTHQNAKIAFLWRFGKAMATKLGSKTLKRP